MNKDTSHHDYEDHHYDDHDDHDDHHEHIPIGERIMHVLRDKIGFGYVAFGLLLMVIIFLGARNRLLEYFSPQPSKSISASTAATKPQAQTSSSTLPDQQPQPQPSSQAQLQAQPQSTEQPQLQPHDNTNNVASSSLNTADIEAAVKDFIMKHPEVIVESLTKLQQKVAEQRALASKEYINKSGDKIVSGKPFIGNASGNTVITEFFDYRCGYCKKVYPDLKKLTQEYPDLKVTFVELPFAGLPSAKAVKFSLAVNALYPEQFGVFHEALLNAASIDDNTIFALIAQFNMDKTALITKANSDEIDQAIKENMLQANSTGVQGVPSFLINGEFIQGALSYDELKKKIDAIKKKE